MIVTPVVRRSVSDAVYEQLLQAIVSDEFAPGSTLPSERDLAEQAGVNRQAVREALQRLREAALVDIVHGGGAYVRDWRRSADLSLLPDLLRDASGHLRVREALSLVQMRTAVGRDMAGRAARLRTDADIERLARSVDDARVLHDGREVAALDVVMAFEEIWLGVARASQNVAFQMLSTVFRDAARQYVVIFPARVVPAPAILGLHIRMVDAIAAGDSMAAATAGGSVVDGVRDSLQRRVDR